MSISTLQEKFFNKGCGTVVFGLAAVAMVASMFVKSGGSSSPGANGAEEMKSVVTVGGVPVPAALIEQQASQMQTQALQQQAMMSKSSPDSVGSPDAMLKATALVNATNLTLQKAAVQSILAQEPPTDAEVQAFGPTVANYEIDNLKQSLERSGKLKPGATDSDVEKAMKDQLGGKTLAEIRSQATKNIVDLYKTKKESFLEQFGGPLLVQRFGQKAITNDQALRDSFKTYVVRRIFLSSTSGSKDTPEVRAEKALADLKAGKSFESVMDAASNDPAMPGKKAHDLSENIPAAGFDNRPELAELKGKPDGATTGVVDAAGGKAVYQLVSSKLDLPKDFDKNKEQIRQQRIQAAGGAQVEKRVKEIVDGSGVKWQSPGYQALALTAKAVQSMGSFSLIVDQAADKAAVVAGETAVKSENPADRRLGAQALLVATDPKAVTAKSGEQDANRRIALEAAQSVGIEDTALSLELAKVYGKAKDGAKVTSALIAASKANSRYDAEGERLFREIAAQSLELQKSGVLTKEQLESVQAQQAAWTSARSGNEKASSQAKTDSVSIDAANAAEIARQKAEAAKAAPAPAKTGSGGADAANAAEIARQKAEAAKAATPAGKAPAGKGQ